MIEDFVLLFDTVCVACLLGGEGRLSLCVFLSVRVSGCMLDVREDSEDYRYAVCVCVCVCERERERERERSAHESMCVCGRCARGLGRLRPGKPSQSFLTEIP